MNRIQTTSGCLAWLDRWGSLRDSANAAWLALVFADDTESKGGTSSAALYRDFALGQINRL